MMTEREALFRIEALLEAGCKPLPETTILSKEVFDAIVETINIAISQGESDEN